MLRSLIRAVHTPLRVAVGTKKHPVAVVLLDKDQPVPDWVKLSESAAEDLKHFQEIWSYDDSSGYRRTLVKKLKEKQYTKDALSVFKCANATIQALQQKKVPNSDIYLPASFTQVLSGYSYIRKTETKPEDVPVSIAELNCINPPTYDLARFQKILKSAEAALYARDLGNLRGSEATPDIMIEKVKTLVASYESLPVTLEIVSGEELAKRGLGMMYAVGKGAQSPPSLVWVSYQGDPEHAEKTLAVIGKGLTFDTGGLNLKPTGSIETMYLDKTGACSALGLLKWVLDTKIPINLTIGLGFVENAIGSRSYKPMDILKSLKGLTVEVGNTDAEGRLVLGDVFTYIQRKAKPTVMVDMATLTGACVIALVTFLPREKKPLGSWETTFL